MRVAIIGTGYVGLVTGACLADAGHDVTCVDIDERKVEAINRAEAPFHEPGLGDVLSRQVGQRLRATRDLAAAVQAASLTMIAVGTPSDGGTIDLRYVEAAARQVGEALVGQESPHVVVVKSTVVPGTTSDRVAPILEGVSGRRIGEGLGLAMNPEFLREGNAIEDFARPDRIVLGVADPLAEEALRELYAPYAPAPILVTNPRTAEAIKYASNALLATLISYSNEIGNIAARLPGVDVRDVMEGVHLDRRWSPVDGQGQRVRPGILSYLAAGCGFGGSCFPKDVQALSAFGRSIGAETRILDAVLHVNAHQPERVAGLLEEGLGSLEGRSLAVLGLSFKPGTDDVRESPALPLVRSLLRRGAHVRAFDPVANEAARAVLGDAVTLCGSLEEAVDGADGVALMTAWPEFDPLASLLERRSDPPLVVDGRRSLDRRRFARYAGIGVGPSEGAS